MSLEEINIDPEIFDYLTLNLNRFLTLKETNLFFEQVSGIKDFLENENEFNELLNRIKKDKSIIKESERKEYGDFQTNSDLTDNVCNLLKIKSINPQVIIEPTCGKGNFIVSAIKIFPDIEKLIGIEIYKPYVWKTKFSVLKYFINNPKKNKPVIQISLANFFDYEFDTELGKNKEILIIGNPPWVTNSLLSVLESDNLPKKSNFKNHNGIDAITGKSNFDIGEFILLTLLNKFSEKKGALAFLIKNSVIKNILFDQFKNKFRISNLEQYIIDTKKEFNASVDSSLFLCNLNSEPMFTIKTFDFYLKKGLQEYGWENNKFVSDLKKYREFYQIDGKCVFEWRQGVKHDCSEIMELEKNENYYLNGNCEKLFLESDLIYGLLKSSDLKGSSLNKPRKYTIITQEKVGQDTFYIQIKYPKIYSYLLSKKEFFEKRKSSIYKGKPLFSIFGIGDYSFKPYKIGISGLYKKTKFTLILPDENKPIMLDDTCYFIGFDNLTDASITQFLLNKKETQDFLSSIIFYDAKRVINKELLMRIDINKVIENTSYQEIKKELEYISIKDWNNYQKLINVDSKNEQLLLF